MVILRSGLLATAMVLAAIPALAQSATPPAQPALGPGGKIYTHASMTTNGPYWANNRNSLDQYRYFIYEPASPAPATAPVILFIHGIFATTPDSYLTWIQHMVLKGYTVVWVQYQSGLTPTSFYEVNARAAWADALNRLQNYWWENHVKPATNTSGQPATLLIGHSVGGFTVANLAATALTVTPKIPVPMGLVMIEPGSKNLVRAENFANIFQNTPMLMVGADQDTVVCTDTEKQIWNGTKQIPAGLKNYLWVQSDTHGTPQQIGNHFFPNTTGYGDTYSIDNRDFNITWKLSVAMADCAFGNFTNDPNACTIALGAGHPLQTSMGVWSDGTPVKPLKFYSDPNNTPPVVGCTN
jgi:hypothetical protein